MTIMPFVHNPAGLTEAILMRERDVEIPSTTLEHAFVANVLGRLAGTTDFDLYGNKAEGMPCVDGAGLGHFEITLYDERGRVVFFHLMERWARGHAYAIVPDLAALSGPITGLLDAISMSHAVDARLITLTVTEEAPGYGRAEWSVNQ